MSNLAHTLFTCGDLEGAHELCERVLEARARALGPEHPDTLMSMNNLANSLFALGDLDSAQQFLERVVQAFKRQLGAEHPDTVMTAKNLAVIWAARASSNDEIGARDSRMRSAVAALDPSTPASVRSHQ